MLGQPMQDEIKKGGAGVALTAPLKLMLQVQPAGTLAPLLLAGQGTALQLEE